VKSIDPFPSFQGKEIEMLLELNQRSSNGTDVALLFDEDTKTVFIEVEDNDGWMRKEIPADKASDAFNHPYLYAYGTAAA
jgi:hypothetical protein